MRAWDVKHDFLRLFLCGSCLPGPERWLILGVSLTCFVENRYLFLLEAEIVDSIFQWDVLKNMRQIKSYDDMFQAIRALTVQKILKIRISSQKFFIIYLSFLNCG